MPACYSIAVFLQEMRVIAIACVMIGGMLCADDSYRAVTTDISLARFHKEIDPAAEKALGVRIGIIVPDFIVPWRLAAMAKACAEIGCIYYRKTCDDRRMTCDYAVGNLGPSYGPGRVMLPRDVLLPHYFSITYETLEALHTAEREIYLALGPEGTASYLPLSQLKITSDAESPRCQRGSTEAGC